MREYTALTYCEPAVWLYDHDEPLWDPNGILTWLSNELHHAERLGQRVWISECWQSGGRRVLRVDR